MSNDTDYIFICPKCGKVAGIAQTSEENCRCRFCDSELVKTDISIKDFVEGIHDGTVKIVERKLFERYVKDNPLYDPDEAELSQAKFQHKKKLHEAEYAAEQASKPHCPVCNSTDIVRINGLRKGLSIVAFGLFSNDIGKTMQCKHCGHKF